MAITQAMCTSFKVDILSGTQNFNTGTTRVYKIALYTSAATLGATTTSYSTADEVSSSGTNYTAGGNTLTVSQIPTSGGTTSYINFADTTWTAATITARGALIYESTQNKAVAVLDFGSDKSSSASNFTIQFPAATSTTAIIRIA
jgi:hypothetical protein